MSINNNKQTSAGPEEQDFSATGKQINETTNETDTTTVHPPATPAGLAYAVDESATPQANPDLSLTRDRIDVVSDMNPEVVKDDIDDGDLDDEDIDDEEPPGMDPVEPRPPFTPTGDPWPDFRNFNKEVEKVDDLLDLSEKYMGLPRITPSGRERKQDETELAVLAIDHLSVLLERRGWGAHIMNGAPHAFTVSHWKKHLDPDMATFFGGFAEVMGISPVVSRSHQFRKKLLKQFHSRCRCEPTEPNKKMILINFRNGTMEINNGMETMRGFRKDDLLTYQLDYCYDEYAECPMFEKYLMRVLPDESSRRVIAEFLGWCFIRNLKLEKVLLLIGGGANGKSVLFDIVRALLGSQNVTSIGLSMLSKMENRPMLATSLLNYASELKGNCDNDIFKKMVSGEPTEARRLYQDMFIMNEYARMAFNVNRLPKDVEPTHGFFRRFLFVPFLQTISTEEMDPDLARKIIGSELPGVFNWVLTGMRRLRQTRQFTECVAAQEALTTYIKESDSVGMFLEEQGYVRSEHGKVTKDRLYQDYRAYCKASGYEILNKNDFGHSLKERHHFNDGKSNKVRFWRMEVQGDPEDQSCCSAVSECPVVPEGNRGQDAWDGNAVTLSL